MTTAEISRPTQGGTGTTHPPAPELLLAPAGARLVAWIQVTSGTTRAMSGEDQRRRQLLLELAERSVRADAGLDRNLAEQINREAWGFNGE
jgi:hypothetical protein